jgi:uncharacterized membrane protein YfbV (UPF0208 family)
MTDKVCAHVRFISLEISLQRCLFEIYILGKFRAAKVCNRHFINAYFEISTHLRRLQHPLVELEERYVYAKRPHRLWGAPSPLFIQYRISFPGAKAAGTFS